MSEESTMKEGVAGVTSDAERWAVRLNNAADCIRLDPHKLDQILKITHDQIESFYNQGY